MCHYLSHPIMMQLEITEKCPFNCPQCYNKVSPISMNLHEIAKHVEQAHSLGVKKVILNGGEPLLHENIIEIFKIILKLNMNVAFYTSGYGLTSEILDVVKSNPKIEMYISLNGSTEKINGYSRQGFSTAIASLEFCKKENVPCGIVWVARSDNVDDFPDLYHFVELQNVHSLLIIPNRPSRNNEITSALTKSDYEFLARAIKRFEKGKVHIRIDACFGLLSAYLNYKAAIFTGCYAGRYSYSVDVRGRYRPCTHMQRTECFNSSKDYWDESILLQNIRKSFNKIELCNMCIRKNKCSPCPLMTNSMVAGQRCVLFEKKNIV